MADSRPELTRTTPGLADRLRVSRQAVAQAVATLERGGYVERVPDPGDARAKLICLTARGRAALRAMRTGAQELERDWEARLGPEKLAEFRGILAELLGGLPARVGREEPPDDLSGVEGRGRRVAPPTTMEWVDDPTGSGAAVLDGAAADAAGWPSRPQPVSRAMKAMSTRSAPRPDAVRLT